MDYSNFDWHAPRPTPAAIKDGWSRTAIRALPSDDATFPIMNALRATRPNGGALLGRFTVEADPAIAWYLSRNRFEECNFFERFFRHSAVVQALPEVIEINKEVSDFQMDEAFTMLGRLAAQLCQGGAYLRYEGSDLEALDGARDFVIAICGTELLEVPVWLNWKAWNLWFHELPWDCTFLWWNKQAGILTFMLLTDTD